MKLGDKVKWTSSGTEKKGTIVRVIKRAEEIPWRIARKEFPNHKTMFDGNRTLIGYLETYLIEVIPGPKAKPRLYMPYPKLLRLVR